MSDPRPLPEICPFLAAASDPDSVLSYPSEDNRCHKLTDSLPVTLDYQTAYCLRARHWFCPVYAGTVKKPPIPIRAEGPLATDETPPAPIPLPVAEPPKTEPRPDALTPRAASGRIRTFFIGGGIILLFAAAAVWASSGGLPGLGSALTATLSATNTPTATLLPSATLTNTATSTPSPSPSPTSTETPEPTATPTASLSPTPSSTPTHTETPKPCTAPGDWKPYTVIAGETYFKIASKFGTTVEALQKVNCLENPGRLLAGQTIFVPPQAP